MCKKKLSIIIFAVLLLFFVILSIFYNKEKKEIAYPTSVKIEVDQVRRGSITRNVTVVGTLVANHTVTIKPQIRGLISKVNINGGEEVEKGSPLFFIDDRSYKAQLKDNRALLASAAAQYQRIKKLSEKNFSAAKKLDEAKTQFLRAQAQFEKAHKDLSDTKILAPYEGIVSLHNVSVGASVSPDMELLTITDVDPIKVKFKIPAKYLKYISIGQNTEITVSGIDTQQFMGSIEAIDATIDPAAQTVEIKASINNSHKKLKPGMFVRVKLNAGSKDSTLIVPEESLIESGDQTYVWKVIDHPKKKGVYVVFRVPVLRGLQEKDSVEIIRGLEEKDIIATVGYHKVADGVPVRFDKYGLDIEENTVKEKTIAESKPTKVNDSGDKDSTPSKNKEIKKTADTINDSPTKNNPIA